MSKVLIRSVKTIMFFYVLRLFIGKKQDLSEKKMSIYHAPLPPLLYTKICATPTA
jgi:hypothetical protein